MGSVFGKNIVVSLFGESHGEAVGVVIDGLPAGITPDEEIINSLLSRRADGAPRGEKDLPEIVSGLNHGKTCGSPLCAVFRNETHRSQDYDLSAPRPNHADLAAFLKYGENAVLPGGGHFSGRLTLPLCFAGGICEGILREMGVSFDTVLLSPSEEEIAAAKADGDSLGGLVRCTVTGLPAGIGSNIFRTVESTVSAAVFAVPGVKGVEFGDGFAFASLRGSEVSDEIVSDDGRLTTIHNHCGGICGGITLGTPVVFRAAFKPTPSIEKTLSSVSYETGEPTVISTRGRHDPCIARRGAAAVESAAAIALLDLLYDNH